MYGNLEGKAQRSFDGGGAVLELVDVLDKLRDRLDEVRAAYPQAFFGLVLVVYLMSPDFETPDISLSMSC
jgi:hypothetical protein